MNLVDRVKNILMQPRQEWPVIAAESTDVKTLYTGYVMILAAIPAVIGILVSAMLGGMMGRFGASVGVGFSLAAAVMGYLLGLGMVYVVALIADALAPNFGGEKNLMQSLKLVAYSMTASWVGALLTVIPLLGWLLSFLASLYGIYLFYAGVETMKKVPEAKAVGYTVIVIIAAIVAGAIIGILTSVVLGMGMSGPRGMGHF